ILARPSSPAYLCFPPYRLNNEAVGHLPHLSRPTDATSATPAPASSSNGRLARMIVVLCFVITGVATALIYWRWANVTEPSSYVVVQGEKEHNGTVVVGSADDLVVRTSTTVDDALLSRAPRLRVVGRGGVGLENIDVAACRRRGVEIVYAPDANTLAVGDFVFGLILQLLRPWAIFRDRAYEPKEFKRIRDTVRGRQLNELTIGILGMGRVGRRVGRIAADGFGMRVLYNDILDIPASSLPFPATSVDKATLYREADVLSLHVTM